MHWAESVNIRNTRSNKLRHRVCIVWVHWHEFHTRETLTCSASVLVWWVAAGLAPWGTLHRADRLEWCWPWGRVSSYKMLYRKVRLVGGWEPAGSAFKEHVLSPASSSLCLLFTLRRATWLCRTLPTWCTTRVQEQQSQVAVARCIWKYILNLPPLGWFLLGIMSK